MKIPLIPLLGASFFGLSQACGARSDVWEGGGSQGSLDASFHAADATPGCPGEGLGAVVTLAAGLHSPAAIAVDVNAVYWAEDGSDYGTPDGVVKKIPRCGGDVVTLAEMQIYPGPLSIDASNLYWASGAGGLSRQIFSVSKAGGVVLPLTSGDSEPSGLAVSDGYVYWGTSNAVALIERTPTSGGASSVIVPGDGLIGSVALDTTSIYWTMGGYGDGALLRTPKAENGGGAVTTLTSLRYDPRQLAVDDVSVYWTEASDDSGEIGDVMKVSRAGGAPVTLIGGQTNPEAIVVDSGYVYWTNESASPDGKVFKTAVDGSSSLVLAADVGYPSAVAVDAQYVYWTTGFGMGGSGTLVRARK